MSKELIIVLCLLVSGCSMSNEEIIKESNKCYAAGMRVEVKINGLNGGVRAIVCWPAKIKLDKRTKED